MYFSQYLRGKNYDTDLKMLKSWRSNFSSWVLAPLLCYFWKYEVRQNKNLTLWHFHFCQYWAISQVLLIPSYDRQLVSCQCTLVIIKLLFIFVQYLSALVWEWIYHLRQYASSWWWDLSLCKLVWFPNVSFPYGI